MDSKEHPATASTGTGRETKQIDTAKLSPHQAFTTERQQNVTGKRLSTAQDVLGDISVCPNGLYCKCPGLSHHTNPAQSRDCRVYLDGAPTIRCVHTSCAAAVAETNRLLRSAVSKAETGRYVPTPVYRKSEEQLAREKDERETERLAAQARALLPKILAAYPWPVEQIFSDSPEGVADDPDHDWRLLLSLFETGDTLWIGDKQESGSPRQAHHFRTAGEWLESGRCPTGPYIVPATLKPGGHHRRKEDVVSLPFLVVESDELNKDSTGAVFRWLHEVVGLPLHAVVDTGGKSLHGWFSRPDAENLRDLAAILPAMQCDGALLSESQPVRLPGCQRPGKEKRQQALLYFNREGGQ